VGNLEDELEYWNVRIANHQKRLVHCCNNRDAIKKKIAEATKRDEPGWTIDDIAQPRQAHPKWERIDKPFHAALKQRRGPFSVDIVLASDVQEFFKRNIQDITKAELHRIKILIGEVSHPLPQKQYRVADPLTGGIGQRRRLKCIRNPEKWFNASAQDVVDEYLKYGK